MFIDMPSPKDINVHWYGQSKPFLNITICWKLKSAREPYKLIFRDYM